MTSNGNACKKFWNLNPCEPLLSQKIPKYVLKKVAIDLFECLNKLYLTVIELAQLPNAPSDTVITHTKSIFVQHGIPKIVFSDNGPQYSSNEFKNFSKSWDFIHQTSTPEFLQSNDLWRELFKPLRKPYKNAERMIVTHT